MPSESVNRELKAARIEQLLVEAGYTRVTEQSRAAARRAGIKALTRRQGEGSLDVRG